MDEVLDRLREVALSLPGATENVQWGNDLVMKVGEKMFAVFALSPAEPGSSHSHVMSLKIADDDFDDVVGKPGVVPAPYLARAKWAALERSSALPYPELERRVREAHAIVFAKLPAKLRASIAGGVTSTLAKKKAPAKKAPAKKAPAKKKR